MNEFIKNVLNCDGCTVKFCNDCIEINNDSYGYTVSYGEFKGICLTANGEYSEVEFEQITIVRHLIEEYKQDIEKILKGE